MILILESYTAFGSGVSTEIAHRLPEPGADDGYTAFGSGVSTEILSFLKLELKTVCYTAFGSGVSTEIRGEAKRRRDEERVTPPSAQG